MEMGVTHQSCLAVYLHDGRTCLGLRKEIRICDQARLVRFIIIRDDSLLLVAEIVRHI